MISQFSESLTCMLPLFEQSLGNGSRQPTRDILEEWEVFRQIFAREKPYIRSSEGLVDSDHIRVICF